MKKIVQNLEIIVTDNAAIDGTDIMIHSYLNDSQIIYIQRPENIGIARNIKERFLASTGKYFFVLTIILLPAITNAHQIIKGIDYVYYYLTGEYQPFIYWFTFPCTQSMLDFNACSMHEAGDGFTALGCALFGTEALAIKAKALYQERNQDIDNFFNRFTYAAIYYCLELAQERKYWKSIKIA